MSVRRIGFRLRLKIWFWNLRLRVRLFRWHLRLKFAITVFKLKRWRAFRQSAKAPRGIPIVYKTRGRRPGSIIVMHCKHRKYDFTVYRVINGFGTLRKVYP